MIVINDGSRDETADIVREAQLKFPWLTLLDLKQNAGKAHALNEGLKLAQHDLVITVDADSYLHRVALIHIVERYLADPPNTRAVAGTILVRNSRENLLTKTQEWDYFWELRRPNVCSPCIREPWWPKVLFLFMTVMP